MTSLGIADEIEDRRQGETVKSLHAEISELQNQPHEAITYAINFDPDAPGMPRGVSIIGRTQMSALACENLRDMFYTMSRDLEPGETLDQSLGTITVCLPLQPSTNGEENVDESS